MDASVMLKPLLSRRGPRGGGAGAFVRACVGSAGAAGPVCLAAEGALRRASAHARAPRRPPLSRGEVRCLGCTSLDKYRKFIEKDPGLERRFQQVGGVRVGVCTCTGSLSKRISAWSHKTTRERNPTAPASPQAAPRAAL